MISERTFAASFHDFWRELLPLLTPSLVSVLNSGHEQRLLDETGHAMAEVDQHDAVRDASVVSEYAYHLVRIASVEGLPISAALRDSVADSRAQQIALAAVSSYGRQGAMEYVKLNGMEIAEGQSLVARYVSYIRTTTNGDPVSFGIPIKGAGFVSSVTADMAIGSRLIEVKTVKRGLAGKDIRQLIIYLALSFASGMPKWTHAGFLNPRRSTYHIWQVNELIEHLSGGRPAVDVFADLVDFVSSTDVQHDSVF